LRIRDVYPGSRILVFRIQDLGSRISDPKTTTKERVEKKICCHTFICSHKFHKIVSYFIFEKLKKKIWANFQRIIELDNQKIVTKLSKIRVWNPGSEIRDPRSEIRDPRSGIRDPRSEIRVRDPRSEIRDPEKTYSGSQISDPGVKKAPDPGS
jgi:hypothetical protein